MQLKLKNPEIESLLINKILINTSFKKLKKPLSFFYKIFNIAN